jgi:hypothetical protein
MSVEHRSYKEDPPTLTSKRCADLPNNNNRKYRNKLNYLQNSDTGDNIETLPWIGDDEIL